MSEGLKYLEEEKKKRANPSRIIPKRTRPADTQQKSKQKEEQKPKKENPPPSTKENKLQQIPKIKLTKEQQENYDRIKNQIESLDERGEIFISPEELKKMGEEGKKKLEDFLKNNQHEYFYIYTNKITDNDNNEIIEIEGTWLYVYRKKRARERVGKA
ncbi:MAG: hypothetical protein N3D10_01050 [Candidatus Micrarchaeota archaeon]|nr:hypothetical protein [Candidatus Micrarchaeota archaeon]